MAISMVRVSLLGLVVLLSGCTFHEPAGPAETIGRGIDTISKGMDQYGDRYGDTEQDRRARRDSSDKRRDNYDYDAADRDSSYGAAKEGGHGFDSRIDPRDSYYDAPDDSFRDEDREPSDYPEDREGDSDSSLGSDSDGSDNSLESRRY